MQNISLNIPPKTALLAASFGMIYLYAENLHAPQIASCETSVHSSPKDIFSRIKHIITADDFVALRALYKIKSAINDVFSSDFGECHCEISPKKMEELFYPVMDRNDKNKFLAFTGALSKMSSLADGFSSLSSLGGNGGIGGMFSDIFNNKNVTDRAVDAEYDVSDEKDDDEEYEEILSLIKGMRE